MNQKIKVSLVILVMMVVIGILLFISRNMEAPGIIDQERMAALQVKVEAFAAKNKRAPIDLAELALSPVETQDRTGNTIIYELEGRKVTLRTLGGDQKEGGHMFKADRQLIFYLNGVKEDEPEIEALELGIDPSIVKEGEKRKRASKNWTKFGWEDKKDPFWDVYSLRQRKMASLMMLWVISK